MCVHSFAAHARACEIEAVCNICNQYRQEIVHTTGTPSPEKPPKDKPAVTEREPACVRTCVSVEFG